MIEILINKMEKIYEIFNDSQMSIATHKTCIKKLSAILDKSNNDNDVKNIMNTINRGCLDRLLIHPTKESNIERAMKFYCDFVTR